ncbi:MAG: ATP synthase F1 subunit delta [Clostridia bacterium]|nr:ATP synthase F1 subunit delta [Clostridia bacterium]
MNDLSREYAEALFSLAIEENSSEQYGKELDLVYNSLRENPQYEEFLSSPSIPLSERQSAFHKAFESHISEYVMSFVKLMCEKRYIKYFGDCVLQYKKMLEESKSIAKAQVKSAVSLTEKEKKALKEKLEKISGKTVFMECTVDQSIIGGLIVEMDGKVINASIHKHLNDIKDVIDK